MEDINTTFKIGNKGEDSDGEYTLEVDETPFDDLEEWEDVGEVPDVGHSTYEEMIAAHTHRFFFLVFLKGRQTPIVVEHNMRSGFATVEVRGKPERSWQVKNLLDAF